MVLGIDIGGTSIKFGIVDDDYHIIYRCTIPTQPELGDISIVNRIAALCSELAVRFPFSHIGIGSAGTIDSKNGICIEAGNLPYRNTPMAKILMDAINKPVTISNDATCAICGELHAGVGQVYRNFVMITLGTGIGGGIIIDGSPYTGKHNLAGEFGHMTLITNGIPCVSCGRDGCYERYASVTALMEFNINKCLYLGIGSSLQDLSRIVIEDADSIFMPQANRTQMGWEIYFQIPYSFITRFFPDFYVFDGKVIRANCYTCSEASNPPYSLSWNRIQGNPLTFHRPQDFGTMIFRSPAEANVCTKT